MSGFNMDDYVDVAERIREFSAKYPEGSLQSTIELMIEPSGWLCTARAYRTADDERPGVGHAFEPVPGKTPYTKDSEAMNAETSAWGRAIVALGFDTKKIASKQEVTARTDLGHEFREPDHRKDDALGLQASSAANVPEGAGAGSVVLSFGKHKGHKIREVPRAYLEWWVGQDEPKTDDLKRQREAARRFLGHVEAGVGAGAGDDIPFARTFA